MILTFPKMKLSNRSLLTIFLLLDLLLLNLSVLAITTYLYQEYRNPPEFFYLLNGIWLLSYLISLDPAFFEKRSSLERFTILFKKFFFYVSVAGLILYFLEPGPQIKNIFFASSVLILCLHLPLNFLHDYLISNKEISSADSRIIIIGAGKIGTALQTFYRLNPSMGRVIGFLDDEKQSQPGINILGKLSDFEKVFAQYTFTEVIISISWDHEAVIKRMVNFSEFNGVRPSIVVNYYSLFKRNFEISNYGGIPIVNIREVPLDHYIPRFWKRLFDLCFSFSVLILLSPIFLLIAMAIKLDSKGPVFYRPIRIGKQGRQIKVYKFRSMVHSTDLAAGKSSTLKNDSRITSIGKFIRRYSLDELPQFLNVLEGDMSVVGPRPHRVDLDEKFKQIVPSYMVRRYIKPGITGWAQVNGFRGLTETKYHYIARTLHDLWYIEHWNFPVDLFIIIMTVFGKKSKRNAY